MLIEVMIGKIHRATVTDSNLDYMGSITIDKALLDAAGIVEGQKVQVVNNNNGSRFETYAIAAEENSGTVCLNGAAARLVQKGDIIIIIAYGLMDKEEAGAFSPKIVFVDERNRPLKLK